MVYERRETVIEYEVGAYDERVVVENANSSIKCNGAYSSFVWNKGGRLRANWSKAEPDMLKAMHWQGCKRRKQELVCYPT